jgi:8-oxo-dGTP pyrophosphatase MutT (NUDIX family)
MLPSIVQIMPWTNQFQVDHDIKFVQVLDRSSGSDTASAVNAAFSELVNLCIERELFDLLCGRHSELFAIIGASYIEPVYVERFAAALFGLTQRGAHMIAYTFDRTGEMYVWISRRSASLYTYPGMLDSTVAGGVKSGVPPLQTIVEEAGEEASLPEQYVRKHARSRGAISHMSLTGKGFPGEQGLVVPDYIYVYDIELPTGMEPRPHDDEVSEFYLLNLPDVCGALLRDEFKPDSAAVLVDFLIRHGLITPENEPTFVAITMRLHRRLPFPIEAG